MFRLVNGKAAMEVLDSHCNNKIKEENELIRHNIVVFSEGERALQVLPPLVDHIPEARLNLAIYYLKHGEIDAAAELMEGIEAETPQTHIVLAILNTELAQTKRTPNTFAKAQSHFQCVGNSSTECDTIPGRQCMASCFYLLRQFDDTMVYLDSIQPYLGEDDEFKWNYGISLAASGKYEDGIETLLKVSKESYKEELAYVLWLAKCFIATKSPEKAWECYLKIDESDISYEILQLIANECYSMGDEQFLYSARAFDELSKIDAFPDYEDGMIGACVGYFRRILVKMHEVGGHKLCDKDSENLMEVLDILESSNTPRCGKIANTIRTWTIQNHVLFTDHD